MCAPGLYGASKAGLKPNPAMLGGIVGTLLAARNKPPQQAASPRYGTPD